MRTPSASFLAKLAEKKLNLCEIFDIELTIGKTYHFTTLDKDITFGEQKYTVLPIARDTISAKMNLEIDTTNLSISNITQELAQEVENNALEGAKITIKRIFYDEDLGEGGYITLFVGYASSEYNRKVLTLRCSSILNSLNIQVPRNLYQESCNFQLFDSNCTLNKESYKHIGSATEVSTNSFDVIDSALSFAAGYYDLGEIEITSGENIGARKMIRVCDPVAKKLTVAVPFRYQIKSGDSYKAFPGCDKTPATCKNKFSNQDNFFGFVYIPRADTTLW